MQLIEEFDSFGALPTARRHWKTYGKTSKNQTVFLGDPPRLSVGERLLGKYVRFYQVHTGWVSENIKVDATSSVGEMQFHLTLDVAYRIAEASIPDAILDGFDVREALTKPLSQFVRKEAKQFGPEDYKRFEYAIEAQIKIEAAEITRTGPVEVGRIEVAVKRDENVADRDEIDILINTLTARLVKATHDGNAGKAASLTSTLDIMRKLQNNKHLETLDVAGRAKDVQSAINDLLDMGLGSDNPVVSSLKSQQTNIVKRAESNYLGQRDTITPDQTNKITKDDAQPKDMD